MSNFDLILIVALIMGFLAIIYFINIKIKELQSGKESDSDKILLSLVNDIRRDINDLSGSSRKEMQDRLDKITEVLDQGVRQSSLAMERQFKESRDLIKETSERISRFEETNRKIAGFASQLQSLENILKNPKHRGVLGEYYLEAMLKNVFEPSQYKMQYKFADGSIVDAVIFYEGKKLPIDSKFSMENYNKMIEEKDHHKKKELMRNLMADLKKRISETSKYIRVKENTFDFVFMFIPSEGVYYDMLLSEVGALKETSQSLIEFAHKKNVILVSPSSFYAYLQTVLHGLRAIDMKESMQAIVKNVEHLDRHLKAYEAHFKRLGNNLGTTVNCYNQSSKEFAKIDKDVYRITEGKRGGSLKIEELEKPELEN